jgi:hypothetical protein
MPATRSETDHDLAESTAVDVTLAALEAELRATGTLSFATCEALRTHDGLHGLEGCLAFLRCTVFASDPDAPPISRRRRLAVCRLMLLSLAAHTDVPRWTSFQVEQMFEAAMQIAGAELSDLVQAQFALLAETKAAPSRAQADFIGVFGRQVAGMRRRGYPADDFMWIAVRICDIAFPATEAQAYLAAHVLPRRLRRTTREVILRIVSPLLADEVARTLARP